MLPTGSVKSSPETTMRTFFTLAFCSEIRRVRKLAGVYFDQNSSVNSCISGGSGGFSFPGPFFMRSCISCSAAVAVPKLQLEAEPLVAGEEVVAAAGTASSLAVALVEVSIVLLFRSTSTVLFSLQFDESNESPPRSASRGLGFSRVFSLESSADCPVLEPAA